MLSIKDRIALGETPDFAGAHWQDIVEPLQPFLVDVVSHMEEQVAQFDPEIAAYTRYALSNQGKHLRPVLLALAGNTMGQTGGDHVKVASIVEMVSGDLGA